MDISPITPPTHTEVLELVEALPIEHVTLQFLMLNKILAKLNGELEPASFTLERFEILSDMWTALKLERSAQHLASLLLETAKQCQRACEQAQGQTQQVRRMTLHWAHQYRKNLVLRELSQVPALYCALEETPKSMQLHKILKKHWKP